jgi:aerotaxis receptor
MPLGRRIAWNFSFLMVALLLQLCWSTGIFPADAGIWRTGMLIVLIGTMGLFWHALHAAVLQPLQQARAACDVMAGGDLTQQDDTDRTDEMGQLLRSLRQLRVNLHSIVGDVRDNFLQISTVTREIASGNMDLSQRTDAQALALQKTASSMGQLAVTVQQNSGNADQASDMAGITRGLAGKVGENVEQVVRMMSDIDASSRKIGDITGMIEAIAFQTNIQALNAAVEAARAGEQGRGFAVVAGEVRSLAQRCSSAANEIKQLIAESLRQVDAGTALAGHAGNSSQEMLESVEKVYGLMSQIALASSEQSHGIGTVQQAITQMDEVTQRNAALVEQSASASAALQDQAIKLEQAMALFKLGRR